MVIHFVLLNSKKKIFRNKYFEFILLKDFYFSQWNKTSEELNSHVVQSKVRKAAVSKSSVPPPPPSSSAQSSSLFGRLSRLVSGASSEEPSEGGASSTAAKKSSSSSKRNFGFATKNLMLHNDKSSEDLYRYKNFSSDHMRAASPEREDNEPTHTLAIENRDDDDDNDNDDDTTEKSSKRQHRKKK